MKKIQFTVKFSEVQFHNIFRVALGSKVMLQILIFKEKWEKLQYLMIFWHLLLKKGIVE